MKNSNVKTALGAFAVLGLVMVANKMYQRRKAMKAILEEYGIKEKTAFGVVDKIREMDDEKYLEMKNKIKNQYESECCKK
ncbi:MULTISPECIES: hypothetical protein [Chryseobacterium]|uniref:Uncharacterized protein n=1 Tax=Chryseobacterium salivictor TaxID=2547600 RepID=A0A4P6ZC06_9FLAO|nr:MULTISPECIES: hypothetical protein [Chryseobacterium]MDQ0477810.1 hypothetical protein [Chryseobacterium sp. MDT2-18]QBO57003.1 hypothetical protein NBC122_00145 [Chryseobacterium salivictor]